jgi:hypothetical protein
MKITPEAAPVGSRLLVKRRGGSFEDPFEVTVLEWSPSGRAVKWRYDHGGEHWSEDAVRYGVLVEKLPPATSDKRKEIQDALKACLGSLSPAKAAAVERGLEDLDSKAAAAVGVYRDVGDVEC